VHSSSAHHESNRYSDFAKHNLELNLDFGRRKIAGFHYNHRRSENSQKIVAVQAAGLESHSLKGPPKSLVVCEKKRGGESPWEHDAASEPSKKEAGRQSCKRARWACWLASQSLTGLNLAYRKGKTSRRGSANQREPLGAHYGQSPLHL